MSEEIEYEVPSWNEIYGITLELAGEVKENGFQPDIILGICRGGWTPARIMSDLLDNSNLANIKVEFYEDVYQTTEEPEITQPVSVPVKDKDILIVDDIADTGKSLRLVKEQLLEDGAAEVRIATLFLKPWSIVKPDFYVRSTSAWVCFPWELFESVKKIGGRLEKEGKSPLAIQEFLVSIGIEANIVKEFVRELFGEG